MAFDEWGSNGVFNQRTGIVDSNGNELFTEANPGSVEIINNGCTTKNSTNLVTVNTDANGTTILAANTDRKSLFIQNNGTVPVLLSFGENTSTTNYSVVLSAASGTRTGDGGTYEDDNVANVWKGTIKGLTESSTAVISILEKE